MDTVSMVYNKYLKSYKKFNAIFGEGNWVINNFLEKSMIYCAFFEIQFPALIKVDISKDHLFIGFIDNPTFQTFHEKHPQTDKTKPLLIQINNNNEKIIIRAIMMEPQSINKSSYVVLNKLNVFKLNIFHSNILKNIKSCATSDNFKYLNYYSMLNTIVLIIRDIIDTNQKNKDAIKEKHMKSIAKIDEMYSIIVDIEGPIQDNINASSSILADRASNNVSSLEKSTSDDEPAAKKTMEN